MDQNRNGKGKKDPPQEKEARSKSQEKEASGNSNNAEESDEARFVDEAAGDHSTTDESGSEVPTFREEAQAVLAEITQLEGPPSKKTMSRWKGRLKAAFKGEEDDYIKDHGVDNWYDALDKVAPSKAWGKYVMPKKVRKALEKARSKARRAEKKKGKQPKKASRERRSERKEPKESEVPAPNQGDEVMSFVIYSATRVFMFHVIIFLFLFLELAILRKFLEILCYLLLTYHTVTQIFCWLYQYLIIYAQKRL